MCNILDCNLTCWTGSRCQMPHPPWPARSKREMSAGYLQPSIVSACISHDREMLGAGTTCYIVVAVSEVRCLVEVTEGACPVGRIRAHAAGGRRGSPRSRRKPQKPRAGVSTLICRHPVAVRSRTNVEGPPCPPSTTWFGARKSKATGRPPQGHRKFPPTSRRSQHMAARDKHTPPIATAPGLDAQGAALTAFPLAGEMPCSLISIRRLSRTCYRERAAAEKLQVLECSFLLAAHSSHGSQLNRKPA